MSSSSRLDGRVIAASGLERVVRDDLPTYDMWGDVDPAYRTRGLGTWLMGWCLRHARVRASREDPGTRVAVGTFAEDVEVGHRALIAATGLEPVRHFFLMRRTGLDDVPDAPLPEGLEIRPVDRGRSGGRSSTPRTRPSATTGAIAR